MVTDQEYNLHIIKLSEANEQADLYSLWVDRGSYYRAERSHYEISLAFALDTDK